jgi:hypothetical protein
MMQVFLPIADMSSTATPAAVPVQTGPDLPVSPSHTAA